MHIAAHRTTWGHPDLGTSNIQWESSTQDVLRSPLPGTWYSRVQFYRT